MIATTGKRPIDAEARLGLVLVVLVAGVAWSASWAMEHASYDIVVGSWIGGILAVASILARREPDPWIARLLLVAPLLKLASAVIRYGVAFVVYDGSADAAVYHNEGVRLQELYSHGVLDADLGRAFVGTGFIRMLTGLLYTVTGPSLLGAFFVFSWLGFWGLYLFHRAFTLAVPEGHRRRYAALVLLLPSLLFWPSSLGKEAWMTAALGLSAYGAARVLTHRRAGFPLVAIGIIGAGAVRPHVAAMVAVALLAAYLTRRAPRGASVAAPVGKLVGLLALGAVLLVAAGQTRSLLGIDSFDADALRDARTEVSSRTDEGGSTFERDSDTDLDPSRFHIAVTNVLFRPFPWEARNPQALIASAEALVLLGLFLIGWRRVVGAVRSVLRTPYVVLSLAYSVLFIYGFSSFANFGILTRQRVQVLPFVLVIICVPPFLGGRRDLRGLLVDETGPRAAGSRHLAPR